MHDLIKSTGVGGKNLCVLEKSIHVRTHTPLSYAHEPTPWYLVHMPLHFPLTPTQIPLPSPRTRTQTRPSLHTDS